MFSTILVIVGIFQMVYAVYSAHRLLKIIRGLRYRRLWFLLIALIYFFLLGYLIYLFLLSTALNPSDITAMLISGVFCFGALFVVLTLYVCSSLIENLNENNTILTTDSQAIQRNQTELKEAKAKLEQKNQELEKVLEDFYTLRMGFERDLESGQLHSENLAIKNRLDELKKQP
jgi:hypothetical protein